MEVGRDALLLQLQRLVGTPPGNQRIARSDLAHDLQLLGPQLEWHETEDADAPGAVSEKVLSLFEQRAHGVLAQHAQSQEGQPPGLGHLQGEGWIVADPGHGPLSDRESGPVRSGQARVGRERPQRSGVAAVVDNRVAHRLQNAADRSVALGEAGRHRSLLAEKHQSLVRLASLHPIPQVIPPAADALGRGQVLVGQPGFPGLDLRQRRRTRQRRHAEEIT